MRTLLIAIAGIGLAAVAATVIIGTMTFDGTVVSDPYTEGLQWDAKRNERSAAGWRISLLSPKPRAGSTELRILVSDRDGRPLEGADVVLLLGRPETYRYDRIYHPARIRAGMYRAAVEFPIAGYWDLRATVTKGERSILLEDRFTVAERNR